MEINPSSIELSSSVHAIIADDHERYKKDNNHTRLEESSDHSQDEIATLKDLGDSQLIFKDNQMQANVDE